MKAFLIFLPQLLEDCFQKVLVALGEYEIAQDKQAFTCKYRGNDTNFIWKTRHGKATTILTWFRYITLKQLQVECKACGSKQCNPGYCQAWNQGRGSPKKHGASWLFWAR